MPDKRDEAAPSTPTKVDHRRPGRLRISNPHLIALFRRPHSIEPTPEAEAADRIAPRPKPLVEPDDDDDNLAAAKGIIVSVLVGAVLWTVIGFCVWYFW